MKKTITFVVLLLMTLFMRAQTTTTETYDFYAYASTNAASFVMTDESFNVTSDGWTEKGLTIADYITDGTNTQSLNGRFAFRYNSSKYVGIRYKSGAPSYTGVYFFSGCHFSICNLIPGDKITITTQKGTVSFVSEAVCIDGSTDVIASGTAVTTDVTYVVQGDEASVVRLDLKGSSGACIQKIVIETSVSESVDAPKCELTASNGVERTVTIISASAGTAGTELEGTFYTLDETEPDRNSTKYTEPFTITETTTIKAISYLSSGTASEVTTFVAEAGTILSLNKDIVKVTALSGENNAPIISDVYSSEGIIGTPEATVVCTFNGKEITLPYTVTENGTLVATASADGYMSSTETLELCASYQLDRSVDFAGLEVTSENIATVLGDSWVYEENKRWSGWASKDENDNEYVYPNAKLGGGYTFNGILQAPGSANIPLRLLIGYGVGRERSETYTIADAAAGEVALYVVDESLNNDDTKKAVEYTSAYVDEPDMAFTVSGAAAIAKVSVYTPVRELVINDNDTECANFAPEYDKYSKITYNRTFNTNYTYSLITLPFAPDAASLATYKFYTLSSVAEDAVTFTEVAAPVANTPYLYCLNEGVTAATSITGGETTVSTEVNNTTVGTWTLVGSLTNQTIDCSADATVNNYIFNPAQNTLHRVKTTLTVYPYTAYLSNNVASTQNNLSQMRVFIGTPTGIKEISRDQIEGFGDKAGMFDLQGRALSNPVKGQIYIENGEKKIKN